MEATIIKIGNSRGLIIPKKMLQDLGAENKVNIEFRDGGLFISAVDQTRKGWEEAFKTAVHDQEPEKNEFEGIENEFDNDEWTW